jgi:ribonuclease Z
MKALTRVLASAASLAFAVAGLGFWIFPEQLAHGFGLEAIDRDGLSTLRADFGAFFLGLGLLVGLGVWKARRTPVLAAAGALALAMLGRAIGWLAESQIAGALELAVEGVAIAILLAYASSLEPMPARTRRIAATVAGAAIVLAAAVGIAARFSSAVAQSIFDRAAMRITGRTNTAPLVDDALRVAVCGSSAPLPSARRAKACVAVFAGGKFWIVDTGPESVENLMQWGVPLAEIGGVLLTHFHSDHIGDLGELHVQTWAGGRPEPLHVYGGPGIERVVAGFNEAYRLDQGYRTAHHGEEVMSSKRWGMVPHVVELEGPPTAAKDRSAVVLDDGELRITAYEVDHTPIEPAYAFRFDYKGRSALVTGDLRNHPPLVEAARGADVLVSEAISRSMTRSLEHAANSAENDRTAAIMHDVQDYHIAPEEAATLANEAGVRLLVFYHLLPAPDDWLTRQLFSSGVNEVRRGDWTIAEDGSLYTLPLGSEVIDVDRIEN